MASDTSPSCLPRCVVTAREEAGRGKKIPFWCSGTSGPQKKSTNLMEAFVGACSVGVCPWSGLLSGCKSHIMKFSQLLVDAGQDNLWCVDLNSAFWSLQIFLWK